MPEFNLYERAAFGQAEPLVQSWPGFTLAEMTGVALASLATRRDGEQALRAAVERAFGLALPEPGGRVEPDPIGVFWMGHEQWFVEAERTAKPNLVSTLASAVGDSASVTDQSDSWARLHVAGAWTRSVLEKLCPLDLHPGAFPAGSTARTTMEHIGAVIMLLGDGETFVLLTPRSSARSFLANLRHAADSTAAENALLTP